MKYLVGRYEKNKGEEDEEHLASLRDASKSGNPVEYLVSKYSDLKDMYNQANNDDGGEVDESHLASLLVPVQEKTNQRLLSLRVAKKTYEDTPSKKLIADMKTYWEQDDWKEQAPELTNRLKELEGESPAWEGEHGSSNSIDIGLLTTEFRKQFPPIPANAANDGCEYRATAISKALITMNSSLKRDKLIKIWIQADNHSKLDKSGYQWVHHVAPAVQEGSETYMFDQSIDHDRPLPLSEWVDKVGNTNGHHTITEAAWEIESTPSITIQGASGGA